MRILFVAAPHPESAWLYKALQESAHSLQRAEDLRDGAFLATQEAFDAIVVMSLDPPSYAGLLDALPQFVEAGAGAAIIVVLGQSGAQDRTRALRAGADACFGQPYSFIEMHERMQALRRTAVSRASHDQPAAAIATSVTRAAPPGGDAARVSAARMPDAPPERAGAARTTDPLCVAGKGRCRSVERQSGGFAPAAQTRAGSAGRPHRDGQPLRLSDCDLFLLGA
jgi:CheY-like chemotaxis protein